ncbi:MFS transporter prlL [Beauveria bassiana]|nr:MFS transporter prlL [Beauveria bassiana]
MEVQSIKASVGAGDVHVGTQPVELGIEAQQIGLERVIRHKFDRRVLPLGIAVHILSTIDRSNMSNAVVLGLREDTDLSGKRFNVVLALFFVTYIVFEIPANLMCQKFGPRLWLSFITFGFGAATVGTSFTHNYPGVLGCRLLLGMFEAGVQPGLLYTYSQFYQRHEMASRWGIKAVGGSVAGAFGGLLGSALGNVPKTGMFERWRWIFLVEGLMTIIVSGLVYWYMPASAAEASFLTHAEKEVAIRRIDQENKMMVGGKDLGAWSLSVMKRALWNANTQLVSLAIMMTLLSMTALSLFMPSLLKSMGYTSTQAQLLTVPPYTVAACICIAACFASDRFQTRGMVLLLLSPLMMAGFLMLALASSTAVRYFALFLTTSATFSCSPILLAWMMSNSAGPSVRVIVGAYVVGEGNIGSIIATWTYLATDAPRYVKGHLVNFGGSCILYLTIGVTTLYLRRENRARDEGQRDDRLADATEDEKWTLGHSHPEYRFTV